MNKKLHYFIVLILIFVFYGCSETSRVKTPCDDISCSGRGECVITMENKVICMCNDGYHSENLECIVNELQCNDNQHEETNVCVDNTKMINCIDISPENADTLNVETEIIWENGKWSDPDSCEWTCKEGYVKVDNKCRGNNSSDTEKPIITLNGAAEITLNIGDNYVDAGATATDNVDGDITENIIVSGDSVNALIPGIYKITYNVSDTAGNEAKEVIRIIYVKSELDIWYNKSIPVQDNTVIATFMVRTFDDNIDALVGFSDGIADEYTDLGIIIRFAETGYIEARDGSDYRAEINVSYEKNHSYIFILEIDFDRHKYNINVISENGENEIIGTDFDFRLEQSNLNLINNVAIYSRIKGSVVAGEILFSHETLPDRIKPIITLNGATEITLNIGDNYVDAGATATDNVDGDITENIIVQGDSIDTFVEGTHIITYNVSDSAGNNADEVKRTVVVGNIPVLVPYGRRAEWSEAGVRGGIPNTENWILKNVITDFNVIPGNDDTITRIKNGIASLPESNKYIIFLPEGSYKFKGTLYLKRSNIVLRGAGTDKTKINCYNPDYYQGCIMITSPGEHSIKDSEAKIQMLSDNAGYIKGSNELIVPDSSKFHVGDFVEIYQKNNPDEITKDTSNATEDLKTILGQFMEINNIEGNKLIFKTRIRHTYLSQFEPKIIPRTLIKNVGIENLSIELIEIPGAVYTIFMNLTSNSWVRNVYSKMTEIAHVAITKSTHCEVRNSRFTLSHDYGGGGRGYGVLMDYHSSDNLAINNNFYKLRHAMIFSQGANGNVIAYNYSDFEYQEYSGYFITWGPDISNHGMYAYMNLIEGNRASALCIADASVHGSSGPNNVYFRNKIVGNSAYYSNNGHDAYYDDKFLYRDVSHYQYVIGNALRTDAVRYPDREYYYADNFEHGNKVKDSPVDWNSEFANHALPDSYFLNSKPDFFDDDDDWPMYGPEIGFDSELPAKNN